MARRQGPHRENWPPASRPAQPAAGGRRQEPPVPSWRPQIGLLRHVRAQPTPLLRHVHPADPATATCSPGRSGYCDMFPSNRPRYCDMFTPQIPLLRHVYPADRATATCSPSRSRYCDMFAPSRPRYCDMFTPQIGLLRHVPPQPTPLLRHVRAADPATATCPSPGRLVRNGVSGQRRRAVTCGNLQSDFSTSSPQRGKNRAGIPSE